MRSRRRRGRRTRGTTATTTTTTTTTTATTTTTTTTTTHLPLQLHIIVSGLWVRLDNTILFCLNGLDITSVHLAVLEMTVELPGELEYHAADGAVVVYIDERGL